MPIEIERKFLVHADRLPPLSNGDTICQGYIPTLNDATVRIRLRGDAAWLTLKGPTTGLSRSEFEYPVPVADARLMLTQLCSGGTIEKIRYLLQHEGLIWEVDVFSGANAGLIVAEVELMDENQDVALPPWVDVDVSHDPRYANSALLQYPYSRWSEL